MSTATNGNTDTQENLWEIPSFEESNKAFGWAIPSFEESNKAFELIDEGVYVVRLDSVDEPVKVLPKYDPSGKKYRARFVFEVVSDVHGDTTWAGTKVSAFYTLTMNEKSYLYPVARALMGGKVDPGQRITPTMLLGREMQCMIAHGDPNDNGDVWPVIKSPMAIRRKTTIRDVEDMMDAEEVDDVPF
jgi:hypothetical protein